MLAGNLNLIKTLEYLDLTGLLANASSMGFFSDSNQDAFKKLAINLPILKNLHTLILDSANVSDNIIEQLAKSDVR